MTLPLIDVVWPNATLPSHSIPIEMCALAFLAPFQIRQIATTRRAGADEVSIEAFVEDRLHAGDVVAEVTLDAHVQNQIDFFLQHFHWEAERRDLRAHHAAAARVLFEHVYFVTERQQIARDRKRRRTRAEQRDALAVLLLRHARHERRYVTFVVCGDALEPADRNRLLFGAHAPTGGFARSVARASENSGEHVRIPVEHVRFGVLFLRNQADVLRHRRMRRTCPLAIDDFVEVRGIENIGGFHNRPIKGCTASIGATHSNASELMDLLATRLKGQNVRARRP